MKNVVENVEKLEPRNVKWQHPYGKQFDSSSKFNVVSSYNVAIPLLCMYPKELRGAQKKLYINVHR